MNPFSFLESPLEDFLRFLNQNANLTVGWAIVVLTVCVRIVILPLFVTQYRSGRRMQQISPQLKAVQAKYKNDKRKQQEEMMKLFQENKVNPFGSCLPLVFQIPVFISLFYVLRNFANHQDIVGDRGFMGIIPDISEQFRDLGWRAVILAAIYGFSQLLATEVSMATTPQTNEWQRKLFRILPLFIVGGLFLYPNVPAGLVLYWLTTNLWTCGQQVVLKRRLGPLQMITEPPVDVEPEPEPEPAKPKPKPKPKAPGSRTSAAAATSDGGSGGANTQGTKKPRPKARGAQSPQRRRPPKKR